MRRLFSILGLSVLFGCGGLNPDNLAGAELLIMQRNSLETTPPTPLFVVFLATDNECLSLSDGAKATVNGESVGDFHHGENPSFNLTPGRTCDDPEFTFAAAIADAPETTVAFEDGARASATFQFLGAQPTLTVTPPADGHIRAGSTIGLSYSPATDERSQDWTFTSAPGQDGTKVQVTIDDDVFRDGSGSFTIPANAPPGPATIRVTGMRLAGVTDCRGVGQCSAQIVVNGNPDTGEEPFKSPRVIIDVEP